MFRRLGLVGVLVLVITAGGGLFGQDEKAPGKGKKTLPTYWSKLNLTAEQRTKVLAIQAEYETKLSALRQQLEQLQQEETREMAKVLTAEQRAKLREIVAAKVGDVPPEKEQKKPGADKKP